jgi:hypothetical protein
MMSIIVQDLMRMLMQDQGARVGGRGNKAVMCYVCVVCARARACAFVGGRGNKAVMC